MRQLVRVAAGVLLALLLVAAGMVAAPAAQGRPTCARAAGEHHVAVVVQHGDGRVLTACVAFTGENITGEQVLNASGIEWGFSEYGSLGKAVCQVDYEPRTYPSNCLQSGQPFWATFIAHAGGAWAITRFGVSRQQYLDGDAAGFRYDPQTGPPIPPPAAGPCPAPVSLPTPATPAPPASSPGASPDAGPPATAIIQPSNQPGGPVTVTAEPSPAPTPTDQPPSSSPKPPAVLGERAAARTSEPGRLDLRWLLASAAFGMLGGLLVVRLAVRRRS